MEKDDKNIKPTAADNNKKVDYEIDTLTIDEIIAENTRRKAALESAYDPIAGVGCCNCRVPYTVQDNDGTLQTHYRENEHYPESDDRRDAADAVGGVQGSAQRRHPGGHAARADRHVAHGA